MIITKNNIKIIIMIIIYDKMIIHNKLIILIVTPRPRKRVDTWQLPRALKWDPVFQAPFKDSQGQK